MSVTLSTSSRQTLQGVASKSVLLAKLTTTQSSNLTTADHIKWDTVDFSSGSDVSLDTTTTYTSTANAASIGRFTLQAGKTYRLTTGISAGGATAANALFQWYNATTNTAIGIQGQVQSPGVSTAGSASNHATALFTPSVTTFVEVRFTSVPDLTAINTNATSSGFALIESIEQVIPVRTPPTGVAYLKDVKANGTVGGTGTADGAFHTRTLNTLTSDPGVNWISLSSNQFTLQPGTYRIHARSPFYLTAANRIRLRNITASSTAIVGDGGYSGSTNSPNWAGLEGIATITSATTYEIQYAMQTSSGTSDLGVQNSAADSTEPEIYTQVKIEKVG